MTENLQKPQRNSMVPADEGWRPPTGDEIRMVLGRANLTGGEAARFLGLGDKGSRTIRRWVGGETEIPFSAWALLCHMAGLGCIWLHEEAGGEQAQNVVKNEI